MFPKLTPQLIHAVLVAVLLSGATGCVETGGAPMQTVAYVDLDRFMGDWYVIANIPTLIEKGAHNAVESYARHPDGTIATTFTFNRGACDGPRKVYRPTGFVLDTQTNARWGMRFIWPIKADYRVIFLDPEYRLTVIGRAKRDYVWIMARTPELNAAEWERMRAVVAEFGYDPAKLQRVPHCPAPR